MALWVKLLITVVVSYLVGNINFALVLSRIKHGDIRHSGSGNPGTMNVVRTYGKVVGVVCLLLDAFKAAVPAFFFCGCARASRTTYRTSSAYTFRDCP